ncbi:MAG: hypothetical protein IKR19_07735 [Acholeplasmatales bacterium]|nr:hypothetical protein [Acholeplasmatales bacterium]
MNTNPIKAVIFENDEIKDTSVMNNIFSLPHEMKLDADLAKLKLLESIKDVNNIAVNDKIDLLFNQKYNVYNYVACFYSSNALDLFRNSLYRFINNNFSSLCDKTNSLVRFIYTPAGILNIVRKNIISEFCDNEEFIRPNNIISGDPSDPSFKVAFIKFEQASDGVIELFTLEYINFINNIVSFIASDNDTLNTIYNDLYRKVYNEGCTHNPDLYTKVNFITIILREIAENEIRLIRNGLSMISSNSTFMLSKQQYSMYIGISKENELILNSKDYEDKITDVELNIVED